MNVYEFLQSVANEIIPGKKYDIRIDINDGGFNSYIGFCVDVEDFLRKKPVTSELRLFRHSNSVQHLIKTWGYELGGVCHAYADHPDIPICFKSYGVTKSDAEAEAAEYFNELRKRIRKRTGDYKRETARSAQEEREKLLARLEELEDTP